MQNMNKILINKVISKEHVELGEDFIAMTVLCYLKENKKEFLIDSHKQSQNLSNAMIVMTCQVIMLLCMVLDIIRDKEFNLVLASKDFPPKVQRPCEPFAVSPAKLDSSYQLLYHT